MLYHYDAEEKIFYYDSEGKDGPYSAADKSASLALHGKSLLLPQDERLWPSVDFINERNEDQEWEACCKSPTTVRFGGEGVRRAE